ncbi:glycosyltransferase family 59 protein [Hypoxylon crocopeplum]|nr:glycosyltransferase family 59 protein [Hypoxylon crocopeplum]
MTMASWLGIDSTLIPQVVRYGLISMIVHIYTTHKVGPRYTSTIIFFSLVGIGLLSRQWLSVVTEHTSEPYLDEVFHIPQAQVYCDGKYGVWDDKLTTPPGLYALTILANKLSGFPCSVYYLRLFNAEVISYLALAAIISRVRLEQPSTGGAQVLRQYSTYAIWTGINVALFPVLFFFSGLYYTDIISTFVVLLSYTNHLHRVSRDRNSLANNVYTVILGLLALCMRQTNIFWVVIYMGGLEVVRGVKTLRSEPVATPAFATLSQQISFYAWRYSLGDIHDPPLSLTSPIDLVLCVGSISIAAIYNIRTIICRGIWPHLTVLSAFVYFVAWNGGVVLGDKSNHVATVHLAQMLYIWPLFLFFSAPLFIPQLLDLAVRVFQTLTGSTTLVTSVKAATVKSNSDKKVKLNQTATLKVFNYIGSCHKIHSTLVLFGALSVTTLIVRYNTIIHPFTLADNRHYMFYIFRYTILRARWIRYALVPAYVACGWLCWAALQGDSSPSPSPSNDRQSTKSAKGSGLSQPSQPLETASPPTSSALILLVATALSLVTAPLVEPRYFILPWVFWRLLVPSRSILPSSIPRSESLVSRRLVLALETAWFLLVNAATMYVFATRPFYWRAPDGSLLDGGRVQRFMW